MAASVVRVKPTAPAAPAAAPAAVPPRWWTLLQAALPPLLNALVLLAVGYFVTGQVEQALKERQATISSMQAMSALMVDLGKASSEPELQLVVRRMSMYGVDAIDPLINMVVTKTLPINLAREGLALIAIRHPLKVCEAIGLTVASRAHFWDAKGQIDLLDKLHERLQCTQRDLPWWRLQGAASQAR